MSNSAKKRRKVEAGPPLSDEELRRYKFNIETPHTIEGYTFDKPDDDEFVRVIKTYEVPHRRNSRKGMVWCTYCKEHNHYIGGIAEYASGARRSVGWKCGEVHLGVVLKEARTAIRDQQVRQDHLERFDKLAVLLPDFLAEVIEAERSTAVSQFVLTQREFRERLPALHKQLADAAFHDDGVLEYDETFIDYSRTVTQKEDEASDDEEEDSKLKGERVRRIKRQISIRGWRFLHPRSDARAALYRARELLEGCAGFYVRRKTDHIPLSEFRRRVKEINLTIEHIEELEGMLKSLPEFFMLDNRQRIVEARNKTMNDPSYSVTARGIQWTPQDRDSVVMEPPLGFAPIRLLAVPRVKRVL